MNQVAIAVRPGTADDVDFIYATWLRSYRHSSAFAAPISNEIFFPSHHLIVERILARKSTSVYIACLPEDPQTIFGYLITEGFYKPIIHFIYVKEAFRKQSIATILLQNAKLDPNKCFFSHLTYACDWLVGSKVYDPAIGKKTFRPGKYPTATYDPYLI